MLWTPFSVDYIQKESLGLLTVYATLVTQVANLMGSSVSVQIERAIGVDSVYYIYGSLVLLICLILCFGLKEVNADQLKKNQAFEEETKQLIENARQEEDSQDDDGEPESKCDKLKKILSQFKESIVKQKSIIVGFVSTFSISILAICGLVYGTLILKQVYAEDDESKDYIADQISIYFLITNIVGWVPAVVLSFMSDRITVWKLLLAGHFFMIAFLATFVISLPDEDHVYTKENPAPLVLPIMFVLCNCTCTMLASLDGILLSKSISACVLSRGILLGTQASFCSLGEVLIDGLGGHIYDLDKRNPYFITLSVECLVITVIIAFAACG